MPDSMLSENDQDALLLAIYFMAPPFVYGQVPRQDIEDVVHDIALDWLIKLRTGCWAPSPENFQAFVRELVRNHVIDRRRKRIRRKDHDGEHLRIRTVTTPAWVSPDRSDDEDVNATLARSLVDKLPDQCRTAHVLIREDGWSYQDTAALLGVSVQSVHTYMGRAQRKLREELRLVGIAVPSPRAAASTTKRARSSAELHRPAPQEVVPVETARSLSVNDSFESSNELIHAGVAG
jgi:RNA polymerase sigma-70 factor (ECF subfamily)